MNHHRTFVNKVEFYIWPLVSICVILALFSIVAPLLFTQDWLNIDFTSTGGIGDTISGTMMPFITLASIILTFLAFLVQYLANNQQKQQIIEQNIKNLIDSFESNLFNLINFHLGNLNKIEVAEYHLRQEVVHHKGIHAISYFNKLVSNQYQVLEKFWKGTKENALKYAFLIFYFGESLIENKNLEKKFGFLSSFITAKAFPINLPSGYIQNGFGAYASPYFRSLFLLFNFIENASYIDEISSQPNKMTKYDYSKIIRANLTNIEQEFLFYNIVSSLGKPWRDNNFILKYKPLKNIMLNSINTFSPVDLIKDELIKHEDKRSVTEFFEFYDE